MQYQVLARKWRPQTFRDLVGQDHVSRALVNALQSGRVAHAFLFSGPRGSGKTTTARILAKALNCHAGKAGEPCGTCPACSETAAGNCMDVLEIDAASNTGVDNIRDLIEQAQYSPARDRHRIFIIDEVHMLSTSAFNALLKTLEEPPAHVVFILATTEYHKIPATILSRCQQYTFRLVKFPLVLNRLREIAGAEKIEISGTALEQVALTSGGSMRDAMSALDQVIAFSGQTVRDEDVMLLLGLVEPVVLAKTARAIASNDAGALLQVVSELVESGQDLQNFCRRVLAHFRNLMVLQAGVKDPAILGVPESLLPDLKAQAELFSREDLLRLFEALTRIDGDVRYSLQPRFQLEMGLVELSQLARLRSLEAVIEEFRQLVESGGGTAAPVQPRPAPGAPSQSRPAPPAAAVPRPVPVAARSVPATAPRAAAAAAPPEVPPQEVPAAVSGVTGETNADLLHRIVERVQKPALAPALETIAGATLQGDVVLLEVVEAGEFLRRQLQENLPTLSVAASDALGKPVRAVLKERSPKAARPDLSPADGRLASEDVLAMAKREPVVQSFLDVFPGPVKAEEIDS